MILMPEKGYQSKQMLKLLSRKGPKVEAIKIAVCEPFHPQNQNTNSSSLTHTFLTEEVGRNC